jgi:hypothetical protein
LKHKENMTPRFLRFVVSLSFFFALLLAAIPGPAYAQTISSVTPTSIVNNIDNTITVTGTGFDNSAAVLLNGSALTTIFLNSQTLTATVPAGFAAGTYAITISMTSGTITGPTLTVTAPGSTATIAPVPVVRPQIAVQNYHTKPENVQYGQDFRLIVKLRNEGQSQAYNVQATFTSGSFLPLKNGGVYVVGDLGADNSAEVDQPMTASTWVYGIVSVDMTISYNDANGASYSEKFTINVRASGGGVAAATSTPTGVKTSQLVITSYATSIDPLQPGQEFTITMTVENTGNVRAQRVTMIVGGGSSSGSSNGTSVPGGVSGGSGEFTNFAPVNASNVQTIGDLPPGGMVQVSQSLIVNVSTNPGAYPMKVTFSYLNDKSEVINDEQVITLLVYSLPTVDVSFYRPPDPFFVGQPGALPVQVVNLGKRLSVLGTMTIEAPNGTVENGTALIGSLDAGGYFTLDAMLIPEQSGPMSLSVTIEYTDDFNQPRVINESLQIEVMEAMQEPILEPGMEGGVEGMPIPAEENTFQKIWRFVLGLFGLDSAPPPTSDPGIMPEPGIEEQPMPAPEPAGKG